MAIPGEAEPISLTSPGYQEVEMIRYRKSILVAVLILLISLTAIALEASSDVPVMTAKKKPPTPTPTSTPSSADFSFNLNLKPQYGWVGYLVRSGDAGPLYEMNSYGSCFWTTNWLGMVSLNGFEGDVTLEVLNLPPGITEEMPASAFVPRGGAKVVTVALRATAAAALGDVTVTLRGTSGTIVHTVDLPFMVVDQLPPLDPSCS